MNRDRQGDADQGELCIDLEIRGRQVAPRDPSNPDVAAVGYAGLAINQGRTVGSPGSFDPRFPADF